MGYKVIAVFSSERLRLGILKSLKKKLFLDIFVENFKRIRGL